jgi:hypothetical protein
MVVFILPSLSVCESYVPLAAREKCKEKAPKGDAVAARFGDAGNALWACIRLSAQYHHSYSFSCRCGRSSR